jgi:SAM-dependent MidA family methyltransferase
VQIVSGSHATTVARRYPSFATFVDAALFDPSWGHYSTGEVRFGEGGHYDTFPTALSPLFGRMVAGAARRFWDACGRPRRFEVCEIGAGNGQLCLDTVATVLTMQTRRPWAAFARAFRYRIVERSPALVRRQREKLGPLAAHVEWTRADLSARAPRDLPLGRYGFVVANEVLDCLPHHKIVWAPDGEARVVYVVPSLGTGATVRWQAIGAIMRGPRRTALRFREVALPLATVPGLTAFLTRHCPERLRATRPFPPYFAAPRIVPLVRSVARLYDTAEMLWIDYGDLRPFHLRTPESRRLFAGPPRSGHSVYQAPGRDDVTFMVDFSVVAAAARDAGLAITYYGGQGALARASAVRLGAAARARIAQSRLVGWMCDVMGLGPERAWRQGGLTFAGAQARGGRVVAGIARDVDEFLGRRPSRFRMIALSTGPTVFPRAALTPALRTGC